MLLFCLVDNVSCCLHRTALALCILRLLSTSFVGAGSTLCYWASVLSGQYLPLPDERVLGNLAHGYIQSDPGVAQSRPFTAYCNNVSAACTTKPTILCRLIPPSVTRVPASFGRASK